MYIQMSIHHPREGKEGLVVASMHRFQEAIRGSQGFRSADTFKDRKSGALVGVAVWDDWESMVAARSKMAESTKSDKFDEWEEDEMQTFQLDVVYGLGV